MNSYQAKIQKTRIIAGGKSKGEERKDLTVWLITAKSIEIANAIAKKFIEWNPNFGELIAVTECAQFNDAVKIMDDENLLFELDAANSDEITISGGIGQKSIAYTRAQIESSVYSEVNESTHSFNFNAGVHQRRVIDISLHHIEC